MIASILSEDDIYQLGSSFRNRFPEEDNLESLKARLSKDRKQGQSPKEYLTKMINQDFVSGDTIVIDGWILSITEARQCALYSKIKSNPL